MLKTSATARAVAPKKLLRIDSPLLDETIIGWTHPPYDERAITPPGTGFALAYRRHCDHASRRVNAFLRDCERPSAPEHACQVSLLPPPSGVRRDLRSPTVSAFGALSSIRPL